MGTILRICSDGFIPRMKVKMVINDCLKRFKLVILLFRKKGLCPYESIYSNVTTIENARRKYREKKLFEAITREKRRRRELFPLTLTSDSILGLDKVDFNYSREMSFDPNGSGHI